MHEPPDWMNPAVTLLTGSPAPAALTRATEILHKLARPSRDGVLAAQAWRVHRRVDEAWARVAALIRALPDSALLRIWRTVIETVMPAKWRLLRAVELHRHRRLVDAGVRHPGALMACRADLYALTTPPEPQRLPAPPGTASLSDRAATALLAAHAAYEKGLARRERDARAGEEIEQLRKAKGVA